MMASMSGCHDDGNGSVQGGESQRTWRAMGPSALADGTLGTSGLLARLARRFGRHSTRDEDVLSHISPAGAGPTPSEGGGVAELRERTLDSLRDALCTAEHEIVPDGQVRQMLRYPCQVARTCDAQVEQLLILLKEAWRALPDARERTHAEAHARLARVVTLCIEEYYEAPARGRTAQAAHGAPASRPRA